ncbi:MAG: hypothetical protein HOP15_07135 [Planctomycetes bacterium]|nr:hypothetical protein [Planctomycetota bacterium]
MTNVLKPLALLALALPASPQTACELAARLDALELRVGRMERAAWSAGPAVVCLDVASDLSPIYPTRALPAGMRELSVAIEPAAAARFGTLTAIFVAADVGAVAPPETEMARSVQPTNGEQRARFRYHQEAPLPPGAYRVELLGDGAPWCVLRFRVLPEFGAAQIVPAFPLEAGRAWSYAFVQEAAEGARLVDGDVPMGERIAGTVEIRVLATGAAESAGPTRIEIRRDGALVAEEAWRWDEQGLVATSRVADGEELALDPPQPLLLSASGVQAWHYLNAPLGYDQHGRQWGPLPLAGPWGSAQGFVVRTEQAEGELVHVAEREFVPGIGLVRERIVSARGGLLVARQELVLSPLAR